MNYVFSHFGKEPNHLKTFFNCILSTDTEAQIFFISDYKFKSKKITTLNLKNYSELENKFEDIKVLTHSTSIDNNPLWATSFFRLYAIQKIVDHFNLENFVHFDTDIIIYEPFNELNNNGLFSNNAINITFHDKKNLVFGYSYFPHRKLLGSLIKEFEDIISNYKYYQNRFTSDGNGFVSEMKILSIISKESPDLFYFLESLPYSKNKYLFDPAGYGQYLDGTHHKRGNYLLKRRWVGLHTEVGREIKSKRIQVKFKNSKPLVVHKKNEFKLASLHVHSKRLHKFLPINYSSIV